MRVPLARMDPRMALFVVMPAVLVPGVLFVLASWLPDAQADLLGTLGCLLVTTTVAVWLFLRPSSVEVTDTEVVVGFAMRSVVIPLDDIVNVEVHDASSFNEAFGGHTRVLIASAYGGGGWLPTRAQTFDAYLSGHDSLAVLRRREGRPVLLSPSDPAALQAALRAVRNQCNVGA